VYIKKFSHIILLPGWHCVSVVLARISVSVVWPRIAGKCASEMFYKIISHTPSAKVALCWHRRLIVVYFLFVSLPVSAHQKCKKTYYFCPGGISSSFAGVYVYFFDKVRVDCYFLFLFSHLACHDAWSTGVVLVVFSSRLVSCFYCVANVNLLFCVSAILRGLTILVLAKADCLFLLTTGENIYCFLFLWPFLLSVLRYDYF